MDKNIFIEILNHYPGNSVEEAQEVLLLKQQYPFSQLLHVLSARLSKDHGFSNQQDELQLAAIYAADRSVLKEMMMTSAPLHKAKNEVKPTIPVQRKEISPDVSNQISKTIDSADLADEVMNDLNRLHELKHNFEMLFIDVPEAVIKKTTHKPDTEKRKTPPAETHSSKSKKERIAELAKNLKAETGTVIDQGNKKQTFDKSKKKGNQVDNLIEEIKSTKKEINPKGAKQKEQLKIIEKFIKAQPTISNSKDKPIQAPVGDLSTIKSGEFGNNIVSETLVEILIKQGKKDKAIEVLKKLIWKFPQKKAYFAAQIADLKK